jgi:hypothetical protein
VARAKGQDKPRNANKRGPAVPHVSQTDETSAPSTSDSREDTRVDPDTIWDNEWLFDEALSVGNSQEFEGPSCDLQAGEALLASVVESRAEPPSAEGSSSDSGSNNSGSIGNGSSSSRSKARALSSHRYVALDSLWFR